MSTNNTEGLNFKILTMGREEVDNRPACNLRPLTLDKLKRWIDSKSIDGRLKEELKKMAGTYPQQALTTWQKNYPKHLIKVQNMFKNMVKPVKPIVELADDSIEEESVPDNNEFE